MKPALVGKHHPAFVLAIGLGLTGCAALAGGSGGNAHGDTADQPVRCELSISTPPGQTVIGGRVSADHKVQGSYRLGIISRTSGGSARINQSGAFIAAPGAPADLGETVLAGSPSQYRAELEISFEGRKMRCHEASGPAEL